MTTTTLSRNRRLASTRLARTVRIRGAGHPDTIEAAREFGAARLAEDLDTARRYGLDDLDIEAVVRTGRLPAEASAA